MNGLQLIAELRHRPRSQDWPAVAVTGFAGPEDAQRALAAGFDAHLGKPLAIEALNGAWLATAQEVDAARFLHRSILRSSESTMNAGKTLLEIAQRHVVDSTAQVARQADLVAHLTRQGRDTTQAQALLTAFKTTLCLMCEVLAREQQRAARRR